MSSKKVRKLRIKKDSLLHPTVPYILVIQRLLDLETKNNTKVGKYYIKINDSYYKIFREIHRYNREV